MKNTIDKYSKLDDYGVLAEPIPKGVPTPDFGKIRAYCKETGKTLADMTQEEIDQFLTIIW